ncbi:MAG TPA: LacI family transcriptional regulator [Clostridiales bacterium]|nr:LacI family transcriptional regulator [Clostridiales bacterium]
MGKITLQVIADKLNISKNTVSKALRGMPGVSDELRRNIIQIAEELGYLKNSSNNGVQGDIQVNITLVCRKEFFNEASFWSQVFFGIMDYSGKNNNISIRTITVDKDEKTYSALNFTSMPCDGYLVVGTISDELLLKINETGLPMVVVDFYNNEIECDYVNTANSRGIYKAVKYLYENNHARIGFISNREGAYSFSQRYEAYLKYMKHFDLPTNEKYIWLDAVYEDTQYYKDKMQKLYSQPDFPTAWICVNDNTALAFYNALKEMNISVPDDISIIGFDNIASIFTPFLTTIEVPRKAIGQRAVEQLMHRINNPNEPYVSIQINTTLVERSSVKKLVSC